MNISQWSMNKILQLPDSCFGSRWPIGLSVVGHAVAPKFDIAEMALPERCVVWELAALYHVATLAMAEFELRLGDVLPASWAEFQGHELLFKGIRYLATATSLIYVTSMTSVNWQNFKMPVRASGRRVILGVNAGVATAGIVQAALTVSSVPTEVLDCLLST
ncbi:hypothetical protein ES703_19518 [subsurface metagenome]